jgi:hypothetical protein
MLASGSALRVQHEWLDAIGRFYRFDAPNCQSTPDFAAIWAANLTTIKAVGGAACHGARSLAGCGGTVWTPNRMARRNWPGYSLSGMGLWPPSYFSAVFFRPLLGCG